VIDAPSAATLDVVVRARGGVTIDEDRKPCLLQMPATTTSYRRVSGAVLLRRTQREW